MEMFKDIVYKRQFPQDLVKLYFFFKISFFFSIFLNLILFLNFT